jgi:hypothetical protein
MKNSILNVSSSLGRKRRGEGRGRVLRVIIQK